MRVSTRLCLSVTILVVLLGQSIAQEHTADLLWNILGRTECSRKGLCPYVKRLIPHRHGFGVDSGHMQASYNHEPPSLCGNLCTNDHQCFGYQKCCPTNCGYACLDPVFISDP